MEKKCPNCLKGVMDVFHRINRVPVHSVMNIHSRKEALEFPRGDISLGFCGECGFISNLDFDPERIMYSEDCEESQGCSPTFNRFLEQTAEDLVNAYDLHGKNIIEIGCGKGEFLRIVCGLGQNTGLGFDPAYDPSRDMGREDKNIKFIKDYYSEKYTGCHGDMVCCRMTLEHIANTHEFVSMIRRSIGDRLEMNVFFQVPNMVRVLRDYAFEDIYYEHCSYFSPGSLSRLFRQCGFEVLDLRIVYEEQYIILEARPVKTIEQDVCIPDQEEDVSTLAGLVRTFKAKYAGTMEEWAGIIKSGIGKKKKIVLWGSGSKAVSFLTGLKIYDEIEFVVDINPRRQGTYMAGTGQRIVSPDFLKDYRPDIVIIMNPIYFDEIEENLGLMNLIPEILSMKNKG